MAKVEIYTWQTCPFCVRAKGLLDRKGVSYTEHSVDGDEPARVPWRPEVMVAAAFRRCTSTIAISVVVTTSMPWIAPVSSMRC